MWGIIGKFPDCDLWRIDLMIGIKERWGRGYGSETIGLLVEFGFGSVGADAVFGFVSTGNTRSRRAFEKRGFTEIKTADATGDPNGSDLVIWRNAARTS